MADFWDETHEDIMNGNMIELSFRGTIKKFPARMVERYLVGNKEFLGSYEYNVTSDYALPLMKLLYNESITIPDAGFLEFLDTYVKMDTELYENLLTGYRDIIMNVFNARFQEIFLEMYPEEQLFNKHFSWDEKCKDRCCPSHVAFNICAPKVLQTDIETIVFTVRDKIFSTGSYNTFEDDKKEDDNENMDIKNVLNYFWWKYDYCVKHEHCTK